MHAGVRSSEAACIARRASGIVGLSPGGVPLQTEVVELCCCMLLLISHLTLLPFSPITPFTPFVCFPFSAFLKFLNEPFLATISFLKTLFLFLGVCGLWNVFSSLFLVLPHSVLRCSNKYDKWGYWCFKNEPWSESLWCLTALMMYLDETMYSNFHFTWHSFAIEHILFETVNGTA